MITYLPKSRLTPFSDANDLMPYLSSFLFPFIEISKIYKDYIVSLATTADSNQELSPSWPGLGTLSRELAEH